jgi:hypothetical protein
MTDEPDRPEDRIADLALQGRPAIDLTSRERAERDALERTAARLAASLAELPPGAEPLPDELAQTLERQAAAFFAGRKRAAFPAPASPAPRSLRLAAWSGWVTAAAALVAVALLLREPRSLPPVNSPAPTTLSERMANLARIAPQLTLQPTTHPLATGASGQLVWDSKSQQGYLRLDGLAPVDRRQGAYQLWIFDANRPEMDPIDGGLFAVDRDDQPTFVPIRATLPVGQPTLFAITLEPPGGVVVSDRNRILLTSQAAAAAP